MKKYNGHLIKSVEPGSIGEELEIEAGDYLLTINGDELLDVFDYQYMINEEYIEVLIRKKDGEEWILEVDKEYDEDLGLNFNEGLMDDYRSCTNKCMFCFIDQMPKGMRETLYFKDDDSRLSFLQGNYITLTNMTDKEIDRIIKYHLYPINISIQTTNKELRCKMLNNRFAGDSLDKIDRLSKACIEMNGQVVLCKGVNDGNELKRTIEDLSKYLPHMRSVSVVPAGITKFRDGLYPLEPFTKEESIQVIDMIEEYQKKFFAEYGLHFIHASDEWYIKAEREIPKEESYDGYIQLENGVGMIRLLMDEFDEALSEIKGDDRVKNISLVTGYLAYDMMLGFSKKIKEKFPNVNIYVYKIRNDYFGETITVSGLITATDIIAQLKEEELGEVMLLPSNILRSGEDVFLDDLHLSDVENALQVKANIVKSTGQELLLSMISGVDRITKQDNNGNFVYITYRKEEDNE
jgi:putative radical SAM enzyme (TIGR03279 family)